MHRQPIDAVLPEVQVIATTPEIVNVEAQGDGWSRMTELAPAV